MKRILCFSAATLWLPAVAYAAGNQPVVSSAGSLMQVIFGLLVVLGLMGGTVWLLKRFGAVKAAGTGNIKIVGGVSVGTRERVLVVEVADQWIVVGVAPGSINSLATMPRQENAPGMAAAPVTPNFASWLKKTIDKRNGN
jgi:flagellar protein FliO/FliZ